MTDRPTKPAKPITPLTVVSSQWPTPDLVRVRFAYDGLVPNGHADAYVKLLFGPDGPVVEPPAEGERPVTRTYTLREVDEQAREVVIDFVVHGDEGLAAPWAANARPGDVVLARGPGGKWSPPGEADVHVFVGDESALPAIAAGLARLQPGARGIVLAEVHEHPVELVAPEGVEVRWLVRGDAAYRDEALAEALDALPWDEFGDVSVFAHGERGAMKAVRRVVREREVPTERLSLSGYWALGRVEDDFQAEKKTELGQV